MAHHISWDNAEKTVVLQQYLVGSTKEDLYLLAKESAKLLATVDHTVHLIIDETNINLTLTTTDMRYLDDMLPSNQGSVIVIPPKNTLLNKRMNYRVGNMISPDVFKGTIFVATIEEARTLLQEKMNVNYNQITK